MSFTDKRDGTPLYPVSAGQFEQWLTGLPGIQQKWIKAAGFRAKAGELCSLPDSNGELHGYAFGMAEQGWLYQLAPLPARLAPGNYRLVSDWTPRQRLQASLGWGLACYQFTMYLKSQNEMPSLALDEDIAGDAERLLSAQALVRDLINTPTEDMGPEQLADAVQAQADQFGARVSVVHGVDLLTKNFPAIHAVGRAAGREPRLVKLEWGKEDKPLLALCGKGVRPASEATLTIAPHPARLMKGSAALVSASGARRLISSTCSTSPGSRFSNAPR
jgi:leucyl aminopeptidase